MPSIIEDSVENIVIAMINVSNRCAKYIKELCVKLIKCHGNSKLYIRSYYMMCQVRVIVCQVFVNDFVGC